MDQQSAKPVLELRHSRRALLFPLLLLQVIGLGVAYVIFALATGLYEPAQLPLAAFGLVAGLALYLSFTALGLSHFISPRYFTLYPDGSADWKPRFKILKLKYPAGVRWAVGRNYVSFVDVSGKHQHTTIALPSTVKKVADVL